MSSKSTLLSGQTSGQIYEETEEGHVLLLLLNSPHGPELLRGLS